jgi:hypothetical protein
MPERQIQRFERQIAEEERQARQARSPENVLGHLQAAMLYKTELAIFRKRRAARVSGACGAADKPALANRRAQLPVDPSPFDAGCRASVSSQRGGTEAL